jgi:hypothetical protein
MLLFDMELQLEKSACGESLDKALLKFFCDLFVYFSQFYSPL